MAKQTINQGTAPTGAGGDSFRSGSAKLQANDNEIYNYLGDGTNLNKLGTAAFKNVGTATGNVMEVGAFGLGSCPVYTSVDVDTYPFTTSAITPMGTLLNAPAGVPSTRSLFEAAGNASYARHFFFNQNAGSFWFRFGQPSTNVGSASWIKVYTSRNTTVDANGFIKAASPIVQIFADKIELNGEAEQQEITFEKLGIGNYLIKGSSGFAQEGWYIETPKDANGNVLFSVIYTTLENGDISVKTYKKKFDFETVSIVADLDNPVDITENRWIDLRLQELPQPEIEMPESITPPEFQPTGLAQAVATVMESYHDSEQ